MALCRWALEIDLHVLCERRVAVSRDEATALADLSRAHHRVLMPCHQYRANPVWRRIRDWLEAEVIGRWHLCEIAVYRSQADRGMSAEALPRHCRGAYAKRMRAEEFFSTTAPTSSIRCSTLAVCPNTVAGISA